jgi:hypothetical protein
VGPGPLLPPLAQRPVHETQFLAHAAGYSIGRVGGTRRGNHPAAGLGRRGQRSPGPGLPVNCAPSRRWVASSVPLLPVPPPPSVSQKERRLRELEETLTATQEELRQVQERCQTFEETAQEARTRNKALTKDAGKLLGSPQTNPFPLASPRASRRPGAHAQQTSCPDLFTLL